MVIIKNYRTYARRFVLFITITALAACTAAGIRNTRIEAKKITLSSSQQESADIENFIAPYRTIINRDMDSILSFAPQNFDKSQGKWQTTIGNLLAEATLKKAANLLYIKEKIVPDACLLNHGGIRAIIAKGNVTKRTAYEVMPFENSVVTVVLKAQQIREMAAYIAREQKPHPIAGMRIIIDDNKNIKAIYIQDKPLDDSKIYNIVTADYLLNGGDKMDFFAQNQGVYDLNYKLRDLYIDYFKETDTLPVITTERVVIQ